MQKNQETWIPSLDREDPLKKDMATHSGILAWRIPQTEEPGGLQSMGSQSQTRLSNNNKESATTFKSHLEGLCPMFLHVGLLRQVRI